MAYDGLAATLNGDDRFQQAANGLTGVVVFDVDGDAVLLSIESGSVTTTRERFRFSNWEMAMRWDSNTWTRYRDSDPPPYHQDLRSAWIAEGLSIEGDQRLALRFWPAMKRLTRIIAERWDDA